MPPEDSLAHIVTVTLQVIDWLLVWRCSDNDRDFTAVSRRATALSRVPAITLPPTLLGCAPSRKALSAGPGYYVATDAIRLRPLEEWCPPWVPAVTLPPTLLGRDPSRTGYDVATETRRQSQNTMT